MREHTFELPSDPRLQVKVPAGVVEIETQSGTEAFVRLSPIVDDEATREAIERAHVELHGNELAVEVKEKRFRMGRLPEIKAEIRVPEGTRAKLHTASADVKSKGRLGDTKTQIASGDVELDRVEGKYEAHSASGDVAVGAVTGDTTIHTASGELELRRTDSGVTVHSASGDVTLGDAGGGPVKVRSASGDVRIAVRSGRRVAVDVRTVSGEAVSDIPLDGTGKDEADAPLVDISVSGVSGDVRIERAAEAALEV